MIKTVYASIISKNFYEKHALENANQLKYILCYFTDIMQKPRESRRSKQYENQHDLHNENLKSSKKRASLFLQAA